MTVTYLTYVRIGSWNGSIQIGDQFPLATTLYTPIRAKLWCSSLSLDRSRPPRPSRGSVLEPVDARGDGDDEPQQGAGQVDPDGVLHPLGGSVNLLIL